MGTSRSLGIYFFSGTGNTEIVSQLLAREATRHGIAVEMTRIEDVLKGVAPLDVARHDMIGIGHPIYGFGTPRIVHDFVRKMPAVHDKPTVVFKSAADCLSINNGASRGLIRRLGRKGYRVFYERIICMPCNWLIEYPPAFARQLYDAAIVKVEHMCQEIVEGKERKPNVGPVLRTLAELSHMSEDIGARFFGKELHRTTDCIDCGQCVNICPTGNIRRKSGRVVFGWDCIWCMRCIYACPTRALMPRFSKLVVLREGYDIARTIEAPAGEGGCVSAATRGYYQHFWRYLEDVAM